MHMIQDLLIAPAASLGELLLRITLAAVLFPHGAQKVLGWFGGPGWRQSYDFFTKSGIPGPLALTAMLTEFLAPIALLLGFMTRPAALGVVILMIVAMSKHIHNGFFMNWFANKKGEGFEYHIIYIGAALALFFTGAGVFSLDALFFGY